VVEAVVVLVRQAVVEQARMGEEKGVTIVPVPRTAQTEPEVVVGEVGRISEETEETVPSFWPLSIPLSPERPRHPASYTDKIVIFPPSQGG
jgi:hypothetical protein